MASTYTANTGVEKIGTGEQSGTWGTTTNLNLDIIDRAINGVGAITLSATTHTLTTTDGALSDGGYKVLVFGGSPGGTCTITISPNDQDKLFFVVNSTADSNSIIIKQGTGATVTISAAKTAIVYADGAGSGAAVAQIETGSSSFTEDVSMKTSSGHALTLQTSDTTVTSGDVLGKLQFQAPNEGSGTDSVLVSASVEGVAEDTFAADNNKTKLSFKTGASETATEKMKIDNGGDVSIMTDGASLFFGADSEIELRHVADDGLILKHVGTGDGKEPSLTFQAGDNDIAADDVLGSIFFQAPDEGAGTDAILVAAGIEAVSEGDFSSSNNATKLSFKTGASEAATEKMSISSAGNVTMKNTATGDDTPMTLTLQTGETDIAASDKLGVIDFQAPDEGTGTDAILVAAGIEAISEGDFSSSSNATKLSFKTASSATAAETMALSSAGALTVTGDITAFASDERLKTLNGKIDSALDKVMNLTGYTFTWNDKAKQLNEQLFGDTNQVGVSAQEVREVCPEVVKEAPFDNRYLTVQYEKLVPLLIEAIKELKTEVDYLKKDR